MQQTTNLGLNKPDYNDTADIGVINGNMDIIDEKITALQSGSGVKIYTVEELTDPAEGKIYNVKIEEATSTINEKPVYKEGTSESVTLKAGKVATVYYQGGNFFYKANASGDALAEHVLAGKTFSNGDDTDIVGTMPNHGGKIFKPSNVNIVISEGFYNGKGYVEGDSNLVAGNIVSGKQIFGVDGNALTYTQSEKQALVDLVNGMGGTVGLNTDFFTILSQLKNKIAVSYPTTSTTCRVVSNYGYQHVTSAGNDTESSVHGLITQEIEVPNQYSKFGRKVMVTLNRSEFIASRYDNLYYGGISPGRNCNAISPVPYPDASAFSRYSDIGLHYLFFIQGERATILIRRNFYVSRPKEQGYPDESYVKRNLRQSYTVSVF